MKLGRTALSYTNLFCTRALMNPRLFWVLVFALAFTLRIAYSLPVHHYQGESDASLSALCAIEVLEGKTHWFLPGGYRLSSQSCYMTAALFGLFGVSRELLFVPVLIYSLIFLITMALFLRRCFGELAGLFGFLFVAFPSPQFMLVTYTPWPYVELYAAVGCCLWVGAEILHGNMSTRWLFAYGLVVGVAMWCSVQSLMVTVPLSLLCGVRVGTLAAVPPAALGFGVGATPYWITVLSQGISVFLGSFVYRTEPSLARVWTNLKYTVANDTPLALVNRKWADVQWFDVSGIAIVLLAAAGVASVVLMFRDLPRSWRRLDAQMALFLVMFIPFVLLLYAGSGAGDIRGWAVRYILPLYLALPISASFIFGRASNRLRLLCGLAALLILGGYASDYLVLTHPLRVSLTQAFQDDREVASWLARSRISLVLGDYWTVYYLNLLTNLQTIALPINESDDYLRLESRVPERGGKLAVLDRDPARLTAWRARVGLEGSIVEVTPRLFAFVPNHENNPTETLAMLRVLRQHLL